MSARSARGGTSTIRRLSVSGRVVRSGLGVVAAMFVSSALLASLGSVPSAAAPDVATYVVKLETDFENGRVHGYQCDIDGQNRYTGNNYEEKGRLFLAERGQVTRVTGTHPPTIISTLGDNKDLGGLITNDWNAIHLVVRGNILMHSVNGHLMSVTIDDDASGRTTKGLIGVQVHVGGPMKVEYRNWRLKDL